MPEVSVGCDLQKKQHIGRQAGRLRRERTALGSVLCVHCCYLARGCSRDRRGACGACGVWNPLTHSSSISNPKCPQRAAAQPRVPPPPRGHCGGDFAIGEGVWVGKSILYCKQPRSTTASLLCCLRLPMVCLRDCMCRVPDGRPVEGFGGCQCAVALCLLGSASFFGLGNTKSEQVLCLV